LQDVNKGWLQKYREHLRRLLPQIDVRHGEIMGKGLSVWRQLLLPAKMIVAVQQAEHR
jgi:hypothetical protein